MDLINTKYEITNTRIINMLLLGKTGVGKTTIIKMFGDPTILSERKVYSQTREAELSTVYVKKKGEPLSATFRIIDTPGIFENREKAKDIRKNGELLKIVYSCVDFHLTELNCVLICVRGDTGFNDQEIEAANVLMDFLGPHFSKITFLAITNTEALSDKRRKDYWDAMEKGEKTQSIARYCQRGPLFVGAPDRDLIEELFDGDSKIVVKRVATLRDVALDNIIASPAESLPTEVLEFAAKIRREEKKAAEDARRRKAEEHQLELEKLRAQLEFEKNKCLIQ